MRWSAFWVLGLACLLTQGRVDLSGLKLEFAAPVFTLPEFSLNALISVALPLFLITLTGQHMPGMLVSRNDGFKTSANPIVTVTGFGSLIMAPFGSNAFNIAAIALGKEAHEDRRSAGSRALRLSRFPRQRRRCCGLRPTGKADQSGAFAVNLNRWPSQPVGGAHAGMIADEAETRLTGNERVEPDNRTVVMFRRVYLPSRFALAPLQSWLCTAREGDAHCAQTACGEPAERRP